MSVLETLTLEHMPSHYAIHLCLFHNVQNAAFLHQQLLARNPEFEYAFIDAATILSRVHLLSALFKAITTHQNGALRTPNIHSETVVSLNPSNNIAEAYRRFGVGPGTKSLIAIKITLLQDHASAPSGSEVELQAVGTQVWDHLSSHVVGDPAAPTDADIRQATNLQVIRKNYKLNGLNWLEAIQDETSKKVEMEKLVVAGMALRGV